MLVLAHQQRAELTLSLENNCPKSSPFFSMLQDYADVSALLYTLRAVLGDGGLPTTPPY
jgi:hypothetical protein